MSEAITAAVLPQEAGLSPAVNEQRLRLAESVPAPLRVDLVIRRQQFKFEDYYVVKDPLSLTYFRLQTEEAYLVGLLDGRRKLREIYAEYRARHPNSERTLEDVALFINHLGTNGLLSINARAFIDTARSQKRESHWLVLWGKVVSGVLFFKIPLVDPSPWLDRLVHAVRFAWRPWAVALSAVFILGTLGLLAVHHEEFSRPGINFFSASNLALIWVTVILVKTLHEFGHATTCRRFGGEVHEMGVALMCFTPCGYVDASDAWMMRHKRHKIYTTIAGVFVELNVAAVAAHLWLHMPDGLARNLAFNTMLVASINTLLFNANPLMRFDGYYLVCDLLEIPNLRGKAISYCSYHLQRLMLGYRNRVQEVTLGADTQGRVFVIYAVFAYVYMIFIIYGLTQVFARVLAPYGLYDLGLLLGFFVEGSFVALPFIKVFMDAFSPGAHIVKLGPTRWYVLRSLAVLGVGALLLFTVPTRHYVTAQAVVGAAQAQDVSAVVGGIVEEVYVHTGQPVKAGDALVRVDNPAVRAEWEQRRNDWEKARLRFAALQSDPTWRSLEALPEAAKAMDQARAELDRIQADLDRLTLRATIDGVVWGRNLEQLVGRFTDTQGVLLRIADPSTLRLLIALPADKAEVIAVGDTVEGRWQGDGRPFTTTVRDVPRQPATPREYTAGMLSLFGGAAPLATQNRADGIPAYPIYLVEAHLKTPEGTLPVEGLRARVTLHGRPTTYAARIGRWLMRLLGFEGGRL